MIIHVQNTSSAWGSGELSGTLTLKGLELNGDNMMNSVIKNFLLKTSCLYSKNNLITFLERNSVAGISFYK